MRSPALNVVGYSFYFVVEARRDKIDTVPFLFGTVLFALSVSAFGVLAGEPLGSINAYLLYASWWPCCPVFSTTSVTWSLSGSRPTPPVIMLGSPSFRDHGLSLPRPRSASGPSARASRWPGAGALRSSSRWYPPSLVTAEET
jgi:hypothetical protein